MIINAKINNNAGYKMKTEYEKPEIEITVFEIEDIITESSTIDNDAAWGEGWQ